MHGFKGACRHRGLLTFADSYPDKRVSRTGIIDSKFEFLPLDIFLESHDSGPVNTLIYGVVTYHVVCFAAFGRFFAGSYEPNHSSALVGKLEHSACRAALPERELCQHWNKCRGDNRLPGLAETSDDNV